MNLDIDRVIELIFPRKYEVLHRLGLDEFLLCFCCSSLNKSPGEPNDINKTWLIQVSGGNSLVPQIRVRNRKLIFLFLNQKIFGVYAKQPSRTYGSFEHPKHVFKWVKTVAASR